MKRTPIHRQQIVQSRTYLLVRFRRENRRKRQPAPGLDNKLNLSRDRPATAWTTSSIFAEIGQHAQSFPRTPRIRPFGRAPNAVAKGPNPGQQGQFFPRSRERLSMLSKTGEKECTCCQPTMHDTEIWSSEGRCCQLTATTLERVAGRAGADLTRCTAHNVRYVNSRRPLMPCGPRRASQRVCLHQLPCRNAPHSGLPLARSSTRSNDGRRCCSDHRANRMIDAPPRR